LTVLFTRLSRVAGVAPTHAAVSSNHQSTAFSAKPTKKPGALCDTGLPFKRKPAECHKRKQRVEREWAGLPASLRSPRRSVLRLDRKDIMASVVLISRVPGGARHCFPRSRN